MLPEECYALSPKVFVNILMDGDSILREILNAIESAERSIKMWEFIADHTDIFGGSTIG